MNESKINSEISAWFTPPEFWTTHCRRCHWTFRADGEGCRPDGYCSYVGDDLPQTPDYFHSEEASARLLQTMLDADDERTDEILKDLFYSLRTLHIDRKQEIVLAFCRFAGIEIDAD